MREIKIASVFHWWITVYPEQDEDDEQEQDGEVNCAKKWGGCGQRHSFVVDEQGDIEFPSIECDRFCYGLEEVAQEDWNEIAKDEYLSQLNRQNLSDRTSAGVKLTDEQWFSQEQDYYPAGYRKGKKEFFICGCCEKVLNGAGQTGKAKNRNNPAFWGLETKERVLCLRCVKRNHYHTIGGEKRKTFRKYLKRGYV